MPIGDGVEAAGIDGDRHALLLWCVVSGAAASSFRFGYWRLAARWLVGSFIDREAGIAQAAEFEATQLSICVGEYDTRRVPDDQQAVVFEQARRTHGTDGIFDRRVGIRWIHSDICISLRWIRRSQ